MLACSLLVKPLLLASLLLYGGASAYVHASEKQVYSARSKIPIPDFNATDAYRIEREDNEWFYIRFQQSVIPIWVSDGFVKVNDNVATVTVDRLNGRLEPNLSSPILVKLKQGYTSVVADSVSGFVKITAPAYVMVAVRKQSLESPITAESGLAISDKRDGHEPRTVNEGESLDQNPQVSTQGDQQNPVVRAAAPTMLTGNLHRLAPGDAINLVVFGESDLSRDNLVVPESGRVSFPLIGSQSVAGLTTAEVETLVQSRLAGGYVRDPKVSVTMFRYRPIFIRGAVRQTGSFEYAQGLTVSKAIALAGGVTQGALADGVSLERNGQVVMQNLSFDSQQLVESGDVISVASGLGEVSGEAFIYLHGEVNQPGEYRFRRGLTVEKAIVLAGGFSMRASKRKVTVTRYIENQEKPVTIKKAELYMPIEPGDVIKVGASFF